MHKNNLRYHNSCPCAIRFKEVTGQGHTPALVCKKHNIFLKWLSADDADYIINQNLVPVEPWKELSRPKIVNSMIRNSRKNNAATKKQHRA